MIAFALGAGALWLLGVVLAAIAATISGAIPVLSLLSLLIVVVGLLRAAQWGSRHV